jgi:acetyl esterase/lipase
MAQPGESAGANKMAVPVGGAVFLNILQAPSEETLDFLYNAHDAVSCTGLPEPDDIVGWSRLQERVERYALPESDQLVERLSPAIAGFSLGGVPVLDVRPRYWNQEKKVAIYMHDGGFMLYSAASTLGRAALVADDTALRVISVDYTLAPVSTFDEITDQVVAVVRTISTQGYKLEDILMLGDGSGAGLAIAAILKARNLGLGLPAAAVLISPYIDLSSADDSDYTPHSVISPSLNASFTGEMNLLKDLRRRGHAHSIPIYADFFKGFPSTLIQGSAQGPWLNDFVRLYHVLDIAGVRVWLDLYEDMPHGFQFKTPDAPESQKARRKLREFARFRITGGGHPELPNKRDRGKLKISKVAKKKP